MTTKESSMTSPTNAVGGAVHRYPSEKAPPFRMVVLATDYDALSKERDELREALRRIAESGDGTVPTNLRRSQLQAIARTALRSTEVTP